MSKSFPIETLCVEPCLHSLYRQLALMEVDDPARILIADSPFLIHPDGALCFDDAFNVRYVDKDDFVRGSALKHELEVISWYILEDRYEKEDLKVMGEQVSPLLEDLRSFHYDFTVRHAKSLRRKRLLH